MSKRKKTGLDIVNGVIAAFQGIIATTQEVRDINDSRITAACARVGEAFLAATTSTRKDWLEQFNRLVKSRNQTLHVYIDWAEQTILQIADVESFKKLHSWDVSTLRDDGIELVEALEKFEPKVRKEAEAARQEVLRLLDE